MSLNHVDLALCCWAIRFHSNNRQSTRRYEEPCHSLRQSGKLRGNFQYGRYHAARHVQRFKNIFYERTLWRWSNVISSIFARSGFRRYRKYSPSFLWFWHGGGSNYFFISSFPLCRRLSRIEQRLSLFLRSVLSLIAILLQATSHLDFSRLPFSMKFVTFGSNPTETVTRISRITCVSVKLCKDRMRYSSYPMEPIIRPFGEQPPAVLERGVLEIVTFLRYERTFSFG